MAARPPRAADPRTPTPRAGPLPGLAAVLLLGPALAGCTAPPGQADVMVAVLLPLSGPLEPVGSLMRPAVDKAAAEVNAAGGIGGKPVRLLYLDAGVDPAQGAAAAQRARDAGARAIVGAVASGVSKAALEVALPAGIPVVSPGSTSPEFTAAMAARAPGERVFFRTVPSDALKAKVAAAYALARGWDRVAMLYDNNPYGNGLEATFEAAYLAGGGNLTSVPFDEGRAGYDDVLQRALRDCSGAGDADCPDGLFFVGYGAEARIAVRDWHARPGWRHVPWFFSELEQELFTGLREAGVPVAGFEGVQPVGTGHGFEAYRRLAGGDPPAFSANAFDAMMLVGLALELAHLRSIAVPEALRLVAGPPGAPVGPADLPGALGVLRKGEDLDYDGASGTMDFDAHGDVTSPYEVFRIAADGTMQRRCLVPEEAVVATPVPLPAACTAA